MADETRESLMHLPLASLAPHERAIRAVLADRLQRGALTGRWIVKARVAGLALIVLMALLAPVAAEAQPAGKVARIGFLAWSARDLYESRGWVPAFREKLKNLGWVEGKNLRIESRFAEGKADRLRSLVGELARLRLDLIVTVTTTATLAAAKAITTTPIVFTVVADALENGIVPSLAHPGGNVTGATSLAPEVAGKCLELLRETVPGSSRVAVLWEPSNPGVKRSFEEVRKVAARLGLTVDSLELGGHDDLEAAFAAMRAVRPDALLVQLAPLTVTFSSEIVAFAQRHQLPTGSDWSGFARAGGLLSYAVPFTDNFTRAAVYVDKILRGASPKNLPVEQPTEFKLAINLKTAKLLGLTVPPLLLQRAEHVLGRSSPE